MTKKNPIESFSMESIGSQTQGLREQTLVRGRHIKGTDNRRGALVHISLFQSGFKFCFHILRTGRGMHGEHRKPDTATAGTDTCQRDISHKPYSG